MWDTTPKAQTAKAKIDKWDSIRLESSAQEGKNQQSKQTQPTEQENICKPHI